MRGSGARWSGLARSIAAERRASMRPSEYAFPPSPSGGGNGAPPPRRTRWAFVLAPLFGFVALAALFYVRLGAGDASRLPSPLIGKVVPSFTLPGLEGAAHAG